MQIISINNNRKTKENVTPSRRFKIILIINIQLKAMSGVSENNL